LREKSGLFEQMRFPTRGYPPTTFESEIVGAYGYLAANLGHALDDGGHVAETEAMYRTAIRLTPGSPLPYKYLGLLLRQKGTNAAEVASLWERYLAMRPDDPQAPQMRAVVDQLRGLRR